MYGLLVLFAIFNLGASQNDVGSNRRLIDFPNNPPQSGRRCGVCPTYMDKICAFDTLSNSTFIFDNACILDLWNCLKGTNFVVFNYEHCLYFGNFAYVHGLKYEDEDYNERHVEIYGSKKNPDFV